MLGRATKKFNFREAPSPAVPNPCGRDGSGRRRSVQSLLAADAAAATDTAVPLRDMAFPALSPSRFSAPLPNYSTLIDGLLLALPRVQVHVYLPSERLLYNLRRAASVVTHTNSISSRIEVDLIWRKDGGSREGRKE